MVPEMVQDCTDKNVQDCTRSFPDYIRKQMKDPEFKVGYEAAMEETQKEIADYNAAVDSMYEALKAWDQFASNLEIRSSSYDPERVKMVQMVHGKRFEQTRKAIKDFEAASSRTPSKE